MKKSMKRIVIVVVFIVMVIVSVILIQYIKKNAPNKRRVDLSTVYKAEGDLASIIYEYTMMEEYAFIVDGRTYLDIDFVRMYINDKIFFDYNELVLSITTPGEVIRSSVDSNRYMVNGEVFERNYDITVVDVEEVVFVSLDFIGDFFNYEHEYLEDPNRVLIRELGKEDELAKVVKAVELRVIPDIKGEVVLDLAEGQEVYVIDLDAKTETGKWKEKIQWSYVMTQDGFLGYIDHNMLGQSRVLARPEANYIYEYTSLSMEEMVSLVWHQVTVQGANNNIASLLEATVGVNVVSPTWFTLSNAEGDITSIASKDYVNTVKNKGMQVWGLVTNQFDRNLTREFLQYTSRRENFIDNIISLTKEYKLDGINIDFEAFNNSEGEAFTQFIRELSVPCRNNGIVLSVDLYVPSAWNLFMDREAIAEVVDYIVVMGYDEHWGGGPVSGSVSSIGFFEKGLVDTLELAPANKIIMGLPFYTRLWEEVDNQIVSYKAYGMDKARQILQENAIEPIWDETTGQFYAEYQIGESVYKIWLEDASSIEGRMRIIEDANIAGFAAWKLGLEDKAVWNIIESYRKE